MKTAITLQIFQVILLVALLVWTIWHQSTDHRIENKLQKLGHKVTSVEELMQIINEK